MLKEFRDFAMRGNVLDLAVGVIIGGAFGKIVTSLVGDILMPLLGLIIGGIDFSGLAFTIGSAQVKYGSFIQDTVDFLIISFVIFLIVKGANSFNKPKQHTPDEPITKDCPHCCTVIPVKATRCPNCTSDL